MEPTSKLTAEDRALSRDNKAKLLALLHARQKECQVDCLARVNGYRRAHRSIADPVKTPFGLSGLPIS